jgi:hypothetical protein
MQPSKVHEVAIFLAGFDFEFADYAELELRDLTRLARGLPLPLMRFSLR